MKKLSLKFFLLALVVHVASPVYCAQENQPKTTASRLGEFLRWTYNNIVKDLTIGFVSGSAANTVANIGSKYVPKSVSTLAAHKTTIGINATVITPQNGYQAISRVSGYVAGVFVSGMFLNKSQQTSNQHNSQPVESNNSRSGYRQ